MLLQFAYWPCLILFYASFNPDYIAISRTSGRRMVWKHLLGSRKMKKCLGWKGVELNFKGPFSFWDHNSPTLGKIPWTWNIIWNSSILIPTRQHKREKNFSSASVYINDIFHLFLFFNNCLVVWFLKHVPHKTCFCLWDYYLAFNLSFHENMLC